MDEKATLYISLKLPALWCQMMTAVKIKLYNFCLKEHKMTPEEKQLYVHTIMGESTWYLSCKSNFKIYDIESTFSSILA